MLLWFPILFDINVRLGAFFALYARRQFWYWYLSSNTGPGLGNPGEQNAGGYGMGRGRERDSRRGATGWDRGNRGYGRGSGQSDYYAMRNLVESVRHNRRITRSQSSQSERTRKPEITSWLGITQNSQLSSSAAGNGASSEQADLHTMNLGTSQVIDTDTENSDTEVQPDRTRDIDRESDRIERSASGCDRGDDIQSSGDVKELLIDIRSEMRYMNQKFDKLENSMTSLKQDNKILKRQNKQLTQQVENLSADEQTVTELAKENERKNERLESQSRRENLKFYGIDESRKETWEESENKVRNYIAEGFNMNETDIKIERAHRLGGSNSAPRPVIVKFSFYKHKERVLRTYRKRRLSGMIEHREIMLVTKTMDRETINLRKLMIVVISKFEFLKILLKG